MFRRCLAVAVSAVALAGTAAAQDTSAAVAARAKTSFTGDLSYVMTSGNSDFATLSIGDRIVHTRGQWTFTQLAGYVRGKVKDSLTTQAFRASLRVDRTIVATISAFVGASTESNKFAGFDSRTDEYGGLTWKVIHSPSDTLALDFGLNYTQQKDVDSAATSYGSARTAEMYKHVFTSNAYFLQLAEYVPSIGNDEGYRFNSESAIVAPVSSHIGIKVNYSLRVASKPPEGFQTTDRVLTMGVQISY